MRALVCCGFMAALVACSGANKKSAGPGDGDDLGRIDTEPQPSDKNFDGAGDDGDEDEGEDAGASDEDDATSDQPKPKPRNDDYEINHRDCDALAGAYGRAWERDEMKQLNGRKLKKAAFDKAAAEIEGNAGEMKDNWRDECYNTVGTAYLKSRLKCAMRAKSMKRFNDCMDGLADP